MLWIFELVFCFRTGSGKRAQRQATGLMDQYGVTRPEASSTANRFANQHLELQPATASSTFPSEETAKAVPTTAMAMATVKMILRITVSLAERSV
jgi:hypothetical protein